MKKNSAIFSKQVLKIVSHIPRGSTLSYKEVAQMAGSPRAYRAVGNILNKNFDSRIPCHRVIHSSGEPGGYNRGRRAKRAIITKEGVVIKK